MSSNHVFILSIYCFMISFRLISSNPDAKRLFEDLFSDYNKLVRPVQFNNDTLKVTFKLKLSQLLDVHEKDQIMTTNVWLQHTWTDENLKWRPEAYGNVDVMYIPADMIWLPDIVLFNNADGNYQVSIMTKAKLSPNGTIEWTPPAIYKSMCQINIEWFPFDIQECDMKFGSWTYGGFELDLMHKDGEGRKEPQPNKYTKRNEFIWIIDRGIDLDDMYPSIEWDILGVPAHRHEKYFRCCEAPFIDITYKIKLRRKTLFYAVNLIFPCVALSFLACLVFYLPSDSAEKISLCISVLISLTIFFLLLVEIIPSTSLVIPLIGAYLLFTMVLVSFSVLVTVITLNVHYRTPNTHEMPEWIEKVFLNFLPKLLRMERPEIYNEFRPSEKRTSSVLLEDLLKCDDEETEFVTIEKISKSDNLLYGRYPHDPVRIAVESVCYVAEYFNKARTEEYIIADWKYVALVMDRLFLWTFSFLSVFGTAAVILRAPALYDFQQALVE